MLAVGDVFAAEAAGTALLFRGREEVGVLFEAEAADTALLFRGREEVGLLFEAEAAGTALLFRGREEVGVLFAAEAAAEAAGAALLDRRLPRFRGREELETLSAAEAAGVALLDKGVPRFRFSARDAIPIKAAQNFHNCAKTLSVGLPGDGLTGR
jgi:hypothetical protein